MGIDATAARLLNDIQSRILNDNNTEVRTRQNVEGLIVPVFTNDSVS